MGITIAAILIASFVAFYIVFIEVFTVIFRATGLTKSKAKYQTISLFTNCGFTTSESEVITSSPIRRRIALIVMIVGHIFSVLIVSIVISAFGEIGTEMKTEDYISIIIILGVFALAILIFLLPFVNKPISNWLEKMVLRHIARKEKTNTITILDSYGKSSIAQVIINVVPESMNDKPLFDMNLRSYSINLLLIKRKNKVIDVDRDTMIQKGDVLVAFGPLQNIKDLFRSHGKVEDTAEKTLENKYNEITLIDNYGKDAMVEVFVNALPEFLSGKPLIDSGLKAKYSINVMMVRKDDKPIPITKDTVIEIHDTIVLFGPYQNIKDVFIKLSQE
ncbi:MAG: TrkA C-terminal domain-containing protein [Acholeplasmatales bacterium]|nr:TrkA C-terminal domain-containing protein [Acholeplasmatales bacterium]